MNKKQYSLKQLMLPLGHSRMLTINKRFWVIVVSRWRDPQLQVVEIMQIWQNKGEVFSNFADWCHVLVSTCLKSGRGPLNVLIKKKYDWGRRLTFKALKHFSINHGDQRFFCQFEIIINVVVSSLHIIWAMLWVHGHYRYFLLLQC